MSPDSPPAIFAADKPTELIVTQGKAAWQSRLVAQQSLQPPETRDRLADLDTATRNLNRARPATGRENNVFADRDGNVARQVGNDWQVRDNNQWTSPEARHPDADGARAFRGRYYCRTS